VAVIARPVLVALAALIALTIPAAGQQRSIRDVPIAAFFGHFTGSGLSEGPDNAYFGVSVRDLDVRIAPEGGGFVITWTSILREGGEAGRPNVRRRSQTLTFVPTGTQGQFRGSESADPASGGKAAWARLARQTLTIHTIVLTPEGRYEMESYNRSLVGNGMEMTYARTSEGERTRTVKGRLIKQAN
jgi:hypothetical protein